MPELPPNNSWKRDTIESAPPRGLVFYEKLTGVNREDLRGKTVLDLGSNTKLLFATELKKNNIECKVISLSPDFTDPKHQPIAEKKESSVAAIAQNLPFADETFDYILDVGGPGVHASKPSEINQWVPEVIRVLKKNGKFVSLLDKLNSLILNRINSKLNKEGHTAYYEEKKGEIPSIVVREIIIKKAD